MFSLPGVSFDSLSRLPQLTNCFVHSKCRSQTRLAWPASLFSRDSSATNDPGEKATDTLSSKTNKRILLRCFEEEVGRGMQERVFMVPGFYSACRRQTLHFLKAEKMSESSCIAWLSKLPALLLLTSWGSQIEFASPTLLTGFRLLSTRKTLSLSSSAVLPKSSLGPIPFSLKNNKYLFRQRPASVAGE